MIKRTKKKTAVVILLLFAGILGACFFLHLHPFYGNEDEQGQNRKMEYDAQFQIEPYISDSDADGDGIDDQTDMLESTRAYIATKPKYGSKYYSGGYPDDGYGVCTDVVAFACLGTGYNLMDLVAEDVRTAQDAYGIETPDPNIDYRRVKNLNVYFSRHAQSLTTDLSDINEWQGGDIVVFDSHIAIVSDKRNARGIPYIIHHVSVSQKAYEQDLMEHWEKKAGIIGHYRIAR